MINIYFDAEVQMLRQNFNLYCIH